MMNREAAKRGQQPHFSESLCFKLQDLEKDNDSMEESDSGNASR